MVDNAETGFPHNLLMRIDQLDDRLSERQDKMARDLFEIRKALVGDEDLGSEGLVKTQKAHGRRIAKVERRLDRAVWTALGAAFGGAFGGGGLAVLVYDVLRSSG